MECGLIASIVWGLVLVVCILIITDRGVKIKITHEHVVPTQPTQPEPVDIDKLYKEQGEVHSVDDIVYAIQKILGEDGDLDE